ncbi:hypothetical protein GUITHDRAFT_154260 [Guillardia theta CCMP2712]|uniref:Uncharacterized protein n=1 Tax=Guillardia theta (strain CCMP2712) TaxID=905079 RepID=L1IUH5_GUITC|nr:hypothetical protein GUITHDRAFT_154260 [Guillardia theta CCMP2712]EKX39901.1 hypothetical protein GUITHDRAFT_154260 [Guillardia theta CCMP2712]|eukprot:XP_005826881.1 hypothetical protein GUITHDRAFT_154260 [Guillardia theta CCMP2712]
MVAGTEAFMGGAPPMLAPSASLSAKATMVGPSSRKAPACLALRMQDNDGPASPKRMGASVDADGKSNVWAVEPKMQVQDPESSGQSTALIGGVAAAGIAAIAAILSSGILNNVEQR